MAGVGRAQVLRLAGVGADRLGAEAEDVALLDQELHRVDVRPGRVLAGLVVVLVGRRVAARFDQSVRISTQERGGMRPCFFSQT